MLRTGLGLLALCCAGCGPAPAPAPRDPFVLVVGGQEANLRESLARAHAVLTPAPGAGPARAADEAVRPGPVEPEPAPRSEPSPERPSPPAPQPPERVVVLEQGMTLYGIARQHLPGRPEEGVRRILERNGWTESQARRLPSGTKVKLP